MVEFSGFERRRCVIGRAPSRGCCEYPIVSHACQAKLRIRRTLGPESRRTVSMAVVANVGRNKNKRHAITSILFLVIENVVRWSTLKFHCCLRHSVIRVYGWGRGQLKQNTGFGGLSAAQVRWTQFSPRNRPIKLYFFCLIYLEGSIAFIIGYENESADEGVASAIYSMTLLAKN